MTAEIAVINKYGIALAADSAVTIGRKRVWKTANKLFSLSPYNDIGIMIYGSGEFIGFPWETIVKYFRQKNGTKKFLTVQNCADDFIEFLRTEINTDRNDGWSAVLILFKHIQEIKKKTGAIKKKREFRNAVKTFIADRLKQLGNIPIVLNEMKFADFKEAFESSIDEILNEEFKENPLTKNLRNNVIQLFYESYKRRFSSDYETGLVIAGFGEQEFFPALLHYKIDGKFKNMIRAWPEDNGHDVNTSQDSAVIIPFAQSDMFQLFLEGIAPQYINFMARFLLNTLSAKSKMMIETYVPQDKKLEESSKQKKENSIIYERFGSEFNEFKSKILSPIMEVVGSLPKEEMAVLAEALVELTSLRRKMDSNLESVGGPTDVALISKGDGFIWIKRKHYFDVNLNIDFIKRKDIKSDLGGSE